MKNVSGGVASQTCIVYSINANNTRTVLVYVNTGSADAQAIATNYAVNGTRAGYDCSGDGYQHNYS